VKLSTRTRYGVRALVDIAQYSTKSPVLLKDVAQRQAVSEDYLEHILIPLKAAGLIKTIRGIKGGFTISKPPAQIRLDEVVLILEKKVALVECVNTPTVYPRSDICATHILWQEITEAITKVLKSTTLLDLMNRQGKNEETRKVITEKLKS